MSAASRIAAGFATPSTRRTRRASGWLLGKQRNAAHGPRPTWWVQSDHSPGGTDRVGNRDAARDMPTIETGQEIAAGDRAAMA
jgi:hypothetical protein